MGLLSHGLAFGLGYMASRPGGRRRLGELRAKGAGLLRHPEVRRLRERGWDGAGEQARVVKRRIDVRAARRRETDRALRSRGRRGRSAELVDATAAPNTVGFHDDTAAADGSQAVITDVTAPATVAGSSAPPPPAVEKR
jgi:hypothetical protein